MDPTPAQATVTITISCLQPLNYTYERPPGDTPWSPPRNLLEEVSSPSCPATAGPITQQPAVGNVTLSSNGSYTFTAPPGWTGARRVAGLLGLACCVAQSQPSR